jgi:general secretion pathway protein L
MEQAIADRRHWLHAPAQRLGLSGFWAWWSAQLAPLVPARPRAVMQRRRMRPVVAFGEDAAAVWVPRIANGTLQFAEVARIALGGDPMAVAQAGRAAIDALPRMAYGGALASAKVGIVLPPGQVLRKTITLPLVVADSLQQTLAYDIDRHTPFKADEVYFDAAIVARDAARKEIRVDLAAALRSVVDPARRRVEAWGATVAGVWPEMPGAATQFRSSRLNLLPSGERADVAAWRRWQLWLPLLAALALALVATALPIWQKRSQVLVLNQLVEQAHQRARASDALRAQLEQESGDYNFALQRKYAFASAMQVLDDVTRLLPDDTWLTQLEVKSPPRAKEPQRDLLLRGESANAGRLVSLLEESTLFEQAAPRSPTTKIQPGPGEIFDLGARLKPLAAPASVQVSSASRPDPAPAAAGAAESAKAASARERAGAAAEGGPAAPAAAAPPARSAPERAAAGAAVKSAPGSAPPEASGVAPANGGAALAPAPATLGPSVAGPPRTPMAAPVVTPSGVAVIPLPGGPIGVPAGPTFGPVAGSDGPPDAPPN